MSVSYDKSYCNSCFQALSSPNRNCSRCGIQQLHERHPEYLFPKLCFQNQFLIGKVLGHGGFAITYLAYDMNLSTRVAIKEYFPRDIAYRSGHEGTSVSPRHESESRKQFDFGLEKFIEEARLLSRIQHPNIIKVKNLFEAGGTAYFVMEYLEGDTLKNFMRYRGNLSFKQAYALLSPLLDAAEFLHQHGIFHRDIKPSNIYITKQNLPLLLDFGSARNQLANRSKSLDVILTPGFAPIEQYSSNGRQGPWTDIYSFGATYYYLLTGNIPPSAIDRVEGTPIIPPSQIGAHISSDEEAWIMRSLAIKPQERPQTITAWKLNRQPDVPRAIARPSTSNQGQGLDLHLILIFCSAALGLILILLFVFIIRF